MQDSIYVRLFVLLLFIPLFEKVKYILRLNIKTTKWQKKATKLHALKRLLKKKIVKFYYTAGPIPPPLTGTGRFPPFPPELSVSQTTKMKGCRDLFGSDLL